MKKEAGARKFNGIGSEGVRAKTGKGWAVGDPSCPRDTKGQQEVG